MFRSRAGLAGAQRMAYSPARLALAHSMNPFECPEFQALFEAVSDAVGLFRDERLLACNSAWCEAFGVSQDQAAGAPEWYWHDTRRAWQAWKAGVQPAPGAELLLRHADGHAFPARLRTAPLRRDEPAAGTLWCVTDLTQQRQAETRRKASEERLRDLLALASEWYWEQDAELRFTYVSRGLFDQYGAGADPVLGKRRWEIEHVFGVTPEQWQAHRDTLEARLPFTDFIYRVKTAAGAVRWVSISGKPVFDEHGEFAGYRGVGSDITERMEGLDAQAAVVHFDPLTALPNRRLLIDRIEQAALRAKREQIRSALLLFDLDGFEHINDTCGFAAGDEVLWQTAARLRGTVRKYDTIARLGGDKFALVLPSINADADIAAVAAKVLEAMRPPLRTSRGPLSVTGSLGIASIPDNADNAEHLFREAERALRSAKAAGGATFRFAVEAPLPTR